MRIPKLSDIAELVRHARLGLFIILAAVGATQVVDAMRGPADQMPGHLIVAAVVLIVGVRLFVAKRSSINRALAEIERLAARHTTTK